MECCMTPTDLSQAWELAASMKIRSLILWDLKCPIKLPWHMTACSVQPSDAQRFGSGTLPSRPVPTRALQFLGKCHDRVAEFLLYHIWFASLHREHSTFKNTGTVCLGMSAGGEARRKGLGRKKGRGCSNDVIPNDGGM